MITTTHHSTVHVLKLPDQIFLHMLGLTTIVSPVVLEHKIIVVNFQFDAEKGISLIKRTSKIR